MTLSEMASRILRVRGSFTLVLLASVLMASGANAQVASYSRMGFGARGIAMGNGLVADASGAGSAYYNPALAPFAARQTINGTVALMSLDRQLQFLEFATPLDPGAGVSAGITHAGVRGIDGRDASGYHTQDYGTDEFAFFLAFGKRFGERLSAGLAFQIFRADFFEELNPSNSIGIDVGFALRPRDALTIGVAVEDLLARYNWETSGLLGEGGKTTRDNFPTRIRVGASYVLLENRLQIVGEYESAFAKREHRTYAVEPIGGAPVELATSEELTRYDYRFRVGGEYLLTDVFGLRIGVDQVGDEASGVKPSAGFLVRQPVGDLLLAVDYAFVLEPYAVGSLHFVTLRDGTGEVQPSEPARPAPDGAQGYHRVRFTVD